MHSWQVFHFKLVYIFVSVCLSACLSRFLFIYIEKKDIQLKSFMCMYSCCLLDIITNPDSGPRASGRHHKTLGGCHKKAVPLISEEHVAPSFDAAAC